MKEKKKGRLSDDFSQQRNYNPIQTIINSRILSSVTMIHPAAVGFRSGHSVVDNASPHLEKRYVLKWIFMIFSFRYGAGG